ncbi:MAG: hypothetical protein J6S67_20025 [Methanobrevibacter sp.]|nr:hypothetical protein [Methanobrevibacter sp.]
MGRPKKEDKMESYLSMKISKDQEEFLDEISSILGVTKAYYVRMMINANMISYLRKKEQEENENKQGAFDNII